MSSAKTKNVLAQNKKRESGERDFTETQSQELEKEFAKNQNPEESTMNAISRKFGIKKLRVEAWFKLRRSKLKLESTSTQEEDKKVDRRRVFSTTQLQELKEEFSRNQRPKPPDRQRIADKIGVTEEQVKNWFNNHRKRDKPKSMKAGARAATQTQKLNATSNATQKTEINNASIAAQGTKTKAETQKTETNNTSIAAQGTKTKAETQKTETNNTSIATLGTKANAETQETETKNASIAIQGKKANAVTQKTDTKNAPIAAKKTKVKARYGTKVDKKFLQKISHAVGLPRRRVYTMFKNRRRTFKPRKPESTKTGASTTKRAKESNAASNATQETETNNASIAAQETKANAETQETETNSASIAAQGINANAETQETDTNSASIAAQETKTNAESTVAKKENTSSNLSETRKEVSENQIQEIEHVA